CGRTVRRPTGPIAVAKQAHLCEKALERRSNGRTASRCLSNNVNPEQSSTNMNKKQALPWDNPRFRNWIAVVRAEKAVVRALTRALAPLDLKIGQLDVLMNLYRHPGMSQHDLARRLLVGRSNITMLLPQLEKQGLLRR